MRITSISLQNFRNYSSVELDFHSRFNILIGKNAQGKTNLLEAVYYLGFLHSFRTSKRKDLIKYDSTHALIEAHIEKNQVHHEIKIGLEDSKRQIKLNGKSPKIYQEYYGLIPILLFEPKDVYLFRDSPGTRRRFINRAVFLQKPSSIQSVRDYEKLIPQKNKLLKELGGSYLKDQLEIWNERIVEIGSQIIFDRLEWIQNINQHINEEYIHLSKGSDEILVDYFPSFEVKENFSLSDIKESFKSEINRRYQEELARRESLVGPHRDDWNLTNFKKSLGQFGSQGENRTGIIALKSSQIRIFENEFNQELLFLLDDVASELDESRKKALYDYLSQTRAQVFLSTTQPKDLTEVFYENGSSFVVDNGSVNMLDS